MRQVRLPWAEPNSRFTVLFERLAIDVLKECDVTGAAQLLRLSWDQADAARTTSPWCPIWTPARLTSWPMNAE